VNDAYFEASAASRTAPTSSSKAYYGNIGGAQVRIETWEKSQGFTTKKKGCACGFNAAQPSIA
jgi:hypothetical protein